MTSNEPTIRITGPASKLREALPDLLCVELDIDLRYIEVDRYSQDSESDLRLELSLLNPLKHLEKIRMALLRLLGRPVKAHWGDLTIEVADVSSLEHVATILKELKEFESRIAVRNPSSPPDNDQPPLIPQSSLDR